MGTAINRRSFLKGSLIATGALAAGSLAGCAQPKSPEDAAEDPGQSATDWLGSAPDIEAEDCASTQEADVIVVGSALAGVLSAYSAIQGGASVIMIERNGAPHISGSGIGFFDSRYQQEGGQPLHDAQVMMHKVVNEGNLRVDTSLVALWAYHSGEILDELEENVLQPAGLPGTISLGEPLDERDLDQYESQFHVDFDPEGNDSLERFVYTFHDWITEHGGTISFNTCARKLVQDEGRQGNRPYRHRRRRQLRALPGREGRHHVRRIVRRQRGDGRSLLLPLDGRVREALQRLQRKGVRHCPCDHRRGHGRRHRAPNDVLGGGHHGGDRPLLPGMVGGQLLVRGARLPSTRRAGAS